MLTNEQRRQLKAKTKTSKLADLLIPIQKFILKSPFNFSNFQIDKEYTLPEFLNIWATVNAYDDKIKFKYPWVFRVADGILSNNNLSPRTLELVRKYKETHSQADMKTLSSDIVESYLHFIIKRAINLKCLRECFRIHVEENNNLVENIKLLSFKYDYIDSLGSNGGAYLVIDGKTISKEDPLVMLLEKLIPEDVLINIINSSEPLEKNDLVCKTLYEYSLEYFKNGIWKISENEFKELYKINLRFLDGVVRKVLANK